MMIRLFAILFIFIHVTCTSQDWAVMSTGSVSPMNHVYISGETNINCFECKYDKKEVYKNYPGFQLSNGSVSGQKIDAYIPVTEFECSNDIMHNDFLELLKAGDYPFIKIEIDPSQIKNVLPGQSSLKLEVSITIADITNIQPIYCQIDNLGNNTMGITGETLVNLADFNLKPPVKFMGLVKVKDRVTINFSFNFIVV